MARAKKPKYEYVESLNLFRKRVKDATGSYVAEMCIRDSSGTA